MPTQSNTRKIYSIYNSLTSHGINDDVIISNLLEILKNKTINNELTFSTLLSDFATSNKDLNYIAIVELIGLTHQKKKEKVKLSSTDERKHNGIYYTDYYIARLITDETVSLYDKTINPLNKSFLEPCSGIGIFALAYLDNIFDNQKHSTNADAQTIINNMYFADIDAEAISLLSQIIPHYINAKYTFKVTIPPKNLYIGDLLFDLNKDFIVKNDPRHIFNRTDGFDIVLTNPPYKLLKANSNKYNDETDNYKKQITKLLNFIRKNHTYKYNNGTLNLYKLFVEEIVENYTKKDGKVGLLIPSTLLSDKQSYELRNRMLNDYRLSTIHTIPEKNEFFIDISQAFCFFAIDKSQNSQSLKLKTNISEFADLKNEPVVINKAWIKSISSLQEVVPTDNKGWDILSKIHKHKKLKEIPSITNLRGELDLTLDKTFIVSGETDYSLLKGDGVKEFVYEKGESFVDNKFVKKLNGKGQYLLSDRLVCQQISNIHSKKRLKFAKIPKGIILGNSCNFITLSNNTLFQENNISLNYLLGILNSLLLNWRFQLTNSNNHIGNYELDELPLAIPNNKQREQVEAIINELLIKPENSEIKAKLNGIVFDLYGLNKDEALYILDKYKNNEVADILSKEINTL
ncbi:MAG: Eco57I restriction-modification methylase domain-containing protein [Patescibacteria group bacterium]